MHVHLPVQPIDAAAILLSRAGDAIVVGGEPCGAATVHTVDSIQVDGEPQVDDPHAGHVFTIDLSGGPFAPGRTDEGDGSSEIEILVDTGPSAGDRMRIVGGPGADVLRFQGADLNLDPSPDDAPDVRLLGLSDYYAVDDDLRAWDDLDVVTRGGSDLVVAQDPEGAHGRRSFFQFEVAGGPGSDRISSWGGVITGGRGDDDLTDTQRADLLGGPGDDRLAVAYGTITEPAHFQGGRGHDVMRGGPDQDFFDGGPGRDSIVGLGEQDSLVGGGGSDLIDGGAGSDALAGEDGADRLWGGAGPDRLYGGPGRDRCDPDERDILVTGCAGPPLH